MKLRYPQLIDEYNYIVENIIPVSTEDDTQWYDEYVDNILNNILRDVEYVQDTKLRREKIEKIRSRI